MRYRVVQRDGVQMTDVATFEKPLDARHYAFHRVALPGQQHLCFIVVDDQKDQLLGAIMYTPHGIVWLEHAR